MPDSLPLVYPISAHAQLMDDALPAWIKTTTPARLASLKAVGLPDLALYTQAGAELKAAIAEHWRSQNALDKAFHGLTDVYAFAEPLLKKALHSYGDVDVRQTFLRTYANAANAWWVIEVMAGQTSRTCSLLDAALYNFAEGDSFVDFAFFGPEDARGQRDVRHFQHSTTGQRLTAQAFKNLCRNLDLGAQYQRQLQAVIGYQNAQVARTLRLAVIANLKAALGAATRLARLHKHIAQDTHDALLRLIAGRPATLGGRSLGRYTLSLMDCRLNGVMLFTASADSALPVGRVIAWVPEDPKHPIKEYPSPLACVQGLTHQLRHPPYRRFFSQFVDHEQRGAFLAGLSARLSQVKWHQARSGGEPSWRKTPIDRPNLQFSLLEISQDTQNRSPLAVENDLWNYLYRRKLNTLLNDARQVAVSTAQVDRLARWVWWDNLEKILSDLLNVALLVVTPFVPVLGQLMLAYTAYQLADEVFEGIIDWAQGRGAEAWQQLIGVAESAVQFGLFGAAGALGEVAKARLSSFVEGLHPVSIADGKTRLWNPDLSPYAQTELRLPADGKPDTQGLHHHKNQLILPLEDAHYSLREDPETDHHRVVHPTRANAYQPHIKSNGHGAWVHEGERPRTWDSATLMRRLGPSVQGFTEVQQEQIRSISGSTDGLLQQVYVRQQPPPPLLRDTLQRFEAYDYPNRASARIRTGEPLAPDPSSDWFEQIVTELSGWPKDKAIEVFQKSDLTGDAHTYGAADATPQNTLRLSLAQVMSGQLPERVLGFLDPAEVHELLGSTVPAAEQVQALRNQLADYVLAQTSLPGYQLQMARRSADTPSQSLLRQQVPGLGDHLARTLLASASDSEQQAIDQQRIPLRLVEQGRELALAERSVHAFEGFYDNARLSADTEQLVLNTLKVHRDSFADLRLEIHQDRIGGPLRSHAGPASARNRRNLVRLPSGRYESVDASGRSLHGAASLYEAILNTLPEPQRAAVGYLPGEGSVFKQWLIDTLEPLAERRKVLAEPPLRSVADPQTVTLLGGPALTRLAEEQTVSELQRARSTLQLLFPGLDEGPINEFILTLRPQDLRSTLNRLTLEKHQLYSDLKAWTKAPTRHPKGSLLEHQERQRRRYLANQLSLSWADRFTEHTNDWGQIQSGARLDISGRKLPESLPSLSANFEHVTYLSMANTSMRQVDTDFLNLFPMLRSLNLNNNSLTRLPPALKQMRFLRYLGIANNQMLLAPEAVIRLARLKRLRVINLSNNPLVLTPDISQMPNLVNLDLSRSQVNAWPTGLFNRNAQLDLNLRSTLVDHVPTVSPGSSAAELVARTRLERNRLTEAHRERYENYRLAAGLDPNRTYEPLGESTPWLDAAAGEHRELQLKLWNSLERENGSQGFFEVIKSLEPHYFESPEDAVRYEANRRQLTEQVWRMLSAAMVDSTLRQKLFMMSSFPGLCADGGAQIFNEMGIEVLANEAMRYSLSNYEREARLVTLAKGTARMKHLGEAIRSDITHRLNPVDKGGLGQRLRSQLVNGVPGPVDEVDIYLAYQTELAERLDLPWLADHMLYRDTANVSTEQIEKAWNTVQAMGENDGLVNRMLLEPYWEQFLRDNHDAECRTNETLFAQRFFELDEQQDSLDEDEYNRRLNELGDQENQWLRDLTRQALERHGERRNRPPASTDL